MSASAVTMAAVFLPATIFGALLTMAWIMLARHRRIEDQPGQRRLHQIATPRGGGIAIAVVVLVALLAMQYSYPSRQWLGGLAAGIAAFSAIGLYDDLLPLRTATKFILQLLASLVLVFGLDPSSGMGVAWMVMLVLACGYVVNIWNFMDGSNGLVAVQSMLVAAALAFWPGQGEALSLVAMALTGACVGFLPFNLPRARVFLGDSGSHALGAAVFGLILASWHAGALTLPQALLITSAMLLDSGLTLLRRAWTGKRIWRAHREHLYQYAARVGHSHLRVCMCYGAWTVSCIILAGLSRDWRSTWVMGTQIAVFSLGAAVYFALRLRWLRPAVNRGRVA